MRQEFRNGMLFLVVFLCTVFFPFPDVVVRSTKAGHWLVVLIYCVVGFIFLSLYLYGLHKLPGHDLIDIFSLVGKWSARVALLPFCLYLILANSYMLRGEAEVLSIVLFKNTPLWAFYLVFLCLATYLASKGYEVIQRAAIMFLLVFGPLLAFVMVMSFQHLDLHFFFPALDPKFTFLREKEFYMGFFGITPFVYLGMANYKHNRVLTKRSVYFYVYAFVVVLLLVVTYIPILLFGSEAASMLDYPLLISFDAIDLEWFVFDRITVAYVMAVAGFLLIYMAVWMWMLTRLITRLYLRVKEPYALYGGMFACFLICLQIPSKDRLLEFVFWDMGLRVYVFVVIPVLVAWIARRKEGDVNEQEVA